MRNCRILTKSLIYIIFTNQFFDLFPKRRQIFPGFSFAIGDSDLAGDSLKDLNSSLVLKISWINYC